MHRCLGAVLLQTVGRSAEEEERSRAVWADLGSDARPCTCSWRIVLSEDLVSDRPVGTEPLRIFAATVSELSHLCKTIKQRVKFKADPATVYDLLADSRKHT